MQALGVPPLEQERSRSRRSRTHSGAQSTAVSESAMAAAGAAVLVPELVELDPVAQAEAEARRQARRLARRAEKMKLVAPQLDEDVGCLSPTHRPKYYKLVEPSVVPDRSMAA